MPMQRLYLAAFGCLQIDQGKVSRAGDDGDGAGVGFGGGGGGGGGGGTVLAS